MITNEERSLFQELRLAGYEKEADAIQQSLEVESLHQIVSDLVRRARVYSVKLANIHHTPEGVSFIIGRSSPMAKHSFLASLRQDYELTESRNRYTIKRP